MSAVETAIIGMGVIIGAGIVTWLTSSVILYARYGAPTISHFPQQDNSINVYGGIYYPR